VVITLESFQVSWVPHSISGSGGFFASIDFTICGVFCLGIDRGMRQQNSLAGGWFGRHRQAVHHHLEKVNSFALDHTLEFTAGLLPNLPRDNATLLVHTQAMQQRAALLQTTSDYLDMQALYFAELSALAKGDTGTGTTRALRKLVEALNKAPDVGGIPRVSKEAVAGLAGHVASWKHCAQVREELQRSAEPVAHALLLNQHILQEQIQWITQREELARQVEYREKVLKPFVEDKKLGETWKNAWMKYIKQVPTIELLEQAKAASIDMQQAWVNVLRGEGSFEHLQGVFDQLNSNIQAAYNHEPITHDPQ